MNNCVFSGEVYEIYEMQNVDGVSKLELLLENISFRKKKNGEKSRIISYIPLEAWHTGAETIEKYASQGCKLTVICSARNDKDGQVVFRINEFNICNQG